MCEALPIKRIPRKVFKFKKDEFGHTAKYRDYIVHVERTGDYWWWDVYYKQSEIAESDFAYKTDAKTYAIAIKRAVRALNKYRNEHQ